MSEVELRIEGGVARVTIDRPASLNAVAPSTERELRAIWERIESEQRVRVVVLTGSGDRAFCVGADFEADEGGGPLDYWASRPPDGFGALALRDTLPVPVIARVNGHALGGGFEMLLGCDLAVAADSATFGLPEPRVGRTPLDGGNVLLPARIPRAFAMELLLTGRRIDAEEALRMGLVNRVVAAAELDAAVDALVADCLRCAPLATRAIKQTVRAAERAGPRQAAAMRLPALVDSLASDEGEEGVAAFKQKRPPRWEEEK